MKRLTIDGLRAVLPELEELRPLVDHLAAVSEADPARTWSGSGDLGTLGSRLVVTDSLAGAVPELARRERAHSERILELTARAVTELAHDRPDDAALTFLEAATLEEARDRPDRAEAYADTAYRVARDGFDATLSSLALRRRARHRRALGRYADALRDYAEAVVVADAADDVRGTAEALVGAGNVEEEQGHWRAAADRYREALTRLERLEAPTPETWHALLNLHVVLRSTGALAECRTPLDRAEEIASSLGDGSALPFIANARGQLLMALGDFEGAERHFGRAIDVATSAFAETTIRLNLAEALLASGRTLDAAEEARRAERRALLAGLVKKLPETYRLLGRIAAREGVTDAFVFFERALSIIDERALPTLERAQTLQAYGEAEALVGDEAAAGELLAEADRAYGSLGITQRREAWADRFGRGDGTGSPPQGHRDGTHDESPDFERRDHEGTDDVPDPEREGNDDER